MTEGPVRYPAMRLEVQQVLEHLGDPEYQQRVWVERQFPDPSYYDDLNMAIHVLYDDSPLGDDASLAVGSILRDQEEAQLVGAVIEAMEGVFAECGADASEEEMMNSAAWPRVVDAARAASQRLALS